ncbi:tRNA-uridine aminocarboxypropyltransferase 1 [Bombyx mori]|uniref:tRNA-uridine aminocarboxypropyltransferase 1 n=1 Tax=Bombyx mori TaxID=7091 RepID=A0A8R1WFV2_BOMMO|nr:tRNA-uridine aminocarboxypropyltransferase 1 [Bombyx mori]
MNPKNRIAKACDDRPFEGLIITNTEPLSSLSSRSACPRCGKSRMYFCYVCFIPVPALEGKIPYCKLPIKVDIIKHKGEINGKSTAAHAAVLAPRDVTVYTYPDIPDYPTDGKVVLLFPGAEAKSVRDLFNQQQNQPSYSEIMLSQLPVGYNVGTLMKKIVTRKDNHEIYHVQELPINHVVIIDSTWNQCRGIYADKRIQKLPTIVLQNRPSQFWRHQKGSPRWYLSTIESLHQLVLELHLCAWGRSENYKFHLTDYYPVHNPDQNHPQCDPYVGQYDNLLFFFVFMYSKLHELYKHEDLLAYKRPMS